MITLDLSWEADFDPFFSCKTTSCGTQPETVSGSGTFDDMKATKAKQERAKSAKSHLTLVDLLTTFLLTARLESFAIGLNSTMRLDSLTYQDKCNANMLQANGRMQLSL